MRVLGQLEVAEFVRGHPEEADLLRAWLSEVRHHRWANSQALKADFRSVEANQPTRAVFRLGPKPIVVETIIDFRNGVVLLVTLSVSDVMRRTVDD